MGARTQRYKGGGRDKVPLFSFEFVPKMMTCKGCASILTLEVQVGSWMFATFFFVFKPEESSILIASHSCA